MKIFLFRIGRGFTLIEVLIALFLISFGLLGLSRFLQGSDRIQKHSKDIMEATLLGQEKTTETLLLNRDLLLQSLRTKEPLSWMQGERNGIKWKVLLEEKLDKLIEIKVKINSDNLRSPLFFTTYLVLK